MSQKLMNKWLNAKKEHVVGISHNGSRLFEATKIRGNNDQHLDGCHRHLFGAKSVPLCVINGDAGLTSPGILSPGSRRGLLSGTPIHFISSAVGTAPA